MPKDGSHCANKSLKTVGRGVPPRRRCGRVFVHHETHEIHERAGVGFIHHGMHRIHGRKETPLSVQNVERASCPFPAVRQKSEKNPPENIFRVFRVFRGLKALRRISWKEQRINRKQRMLFWRNVHSRSYFFTVRKFDVMSYA
jgi:hypothetical protein